MSKKILIADDDARIALLLKVRLEEKGYSVSTAKDGEEALAKARSEKPDLLISDVRMPKMEGDDVYMALRSDPATQNMPILMITGLRTDKEIEADGEENMFAKPVDFNRLLERIQQLLGS